MAVHMIVLAAGFSKRYGKNKLLTVFQGKPLYLHVIDHLSKIKKIKSEKTTLTVVTQYQEIVREMEKRKISVVCNNHSADGISSSLQMGLNFVLWNLSDGKEDNEKEYFCFFVGDQPYLQHETIELFLEGYLMSKKGIGCPRGGDRNGNPVIFSNKYIDELMALKGDVGGKKVLRSHKEDVYFYDVINKKELFDIDRPENHL